MNNYQKYNSKNFLALLLIKSSLLCTKTDKAVVIGNQEFCFGNAIKIVTNFSLTN